MKTNKLSYAEKLFLDENYPKNWFYYDFLTVIANLILALLLFIVNYINSYIEIVI